MHALGPKKSVAFPVFHALTGCDTTSSFGGRGKQSTWEAWNIYQLVTEAFLNLNNADGLFFRCNHFSFGALCLILSCTTGHRTSECRDLNSARMHIFTKKSWPLDLLPPTCDSFLQHVKRTMFQAIHCWPLSGTGTNAATSSWLGMGKRRWKLGPILDNYAHGIKNLQRTTTLCMRKRMLCELQVCKG